MIDLDCISRKFSVQCTNSKILLKIIHFLMNSSLIRQYSLQKSLFCRNKESTSITIIIGRASGAFVCGRGGGGLKKFLEV